MCISFQDTKNSYYSQKSILKNAVNTADIKQGLYDKDIKKLKNDYVIFPILPAFGAAGIFKLLSKENSQGNKIAALVSAAIFTAYSFWSANKTDLSNKAAVNSVLNEELNSANIFTKSSDNDYIKNSLIYYSSENQPQFYNFEFKKQADFLKKIKNESVSEKTTKTQSENKEITDLLHSLDLETKKYSNKINAGLNLASIGLCGLGYLTLSIKSSNLTAKTIKNILGALLFFSPIGLLEYPIRKNTNDIARYKAKEKIFNNHPKQPTGSLEIFTDYLKNYKKYLKEINILNSKTKARNAYLNKIELADNQKEEAIRLRDEFKSSYESSQKINNSSKKTLINDLTFNLAFWTLVPITITQLFSSNQDNKYIKILASTLTSLFAAKILINELELNDLKNKKETGS